MFRKKRFINLSAEFLKGNSLFSEGFIEGKSSNGKQFYTSKSSLIYDIKRIQSKASL